MHLDINQFHLKAIFFQLNVHHFPSFIEQSAHFETLCFVPEVEALFPVRMEISRSRNPLFFKQ